MARWRGSPAATLCVVTVAVFTDTVVYSLVVPILPKYAKSLGASPAAIGFLFASYAIALLATLPLFGIVSDRIGRRRPMLWGLLLLGGATIMFAFARTYPELLVARFLQGTAGAVTWTAGLAAVADVYPKERRAKALGVALSATAAGGLIGPAMGGILYDWGGYRLPFLVVGCLALADGLARTIFLVDVERAADEHPASLRRLLGDRSVWVISGTVIFGATVFSLIEPLLPLRLADQIGASPATVGLLFMVLWLGFGAASPLAEKLGDRFGAREGMALGLLLMTAFVPLLAFPRHALLEAALMVVVGVAVGMTVGPTLGELADAVDRHGGGSYASVYAIWNGFFAVGMVAGPLEGGLLREVVDVRTTLAIAVVPLGLYALFLALGRSPMSQFAKAAPVVTDTARSSEVA